MGAQSVQSECAQDSFSSLGSSRNIGFTVVHLRKLDFWVTFNDVSIILPMSAHAAFISLTCLDPMMSQSTLRLERKHPGHQNEGRSHCAVRTRPLDLLEKTDKEATISD